MVILLVLLTKKGCLFSVLRFERVEVEWVLLIGLDWIANMDVLNFMI